MKTISATRNIFYSLVNNSINTAFPLLIIPFVTNSLSAEAFGDAALLLTIYATVSSISMMGFDSYGLREIGKYRLESDKCNSVYSELVAWHFLVLFAISITILTAKFLGLMSTDSVLLFFTLAALCLSAFQTDWVLFAYGEFKALAFRNAALKVLTLLCVLVVIPLFSSTSTYVIVMLSSYALSSVWTFTVAQQFLHIKTFSWSSLMARLYAARPFMLSSALRSLLQNVDTLVVGLICTADVTAFYFIARKVTQVGTQVFSHLALVFNNLLYSAKHDGSPNLDQLRGLDVSFFLSAMAAVTISANGAAIVNILSGHGYLNVPYALPLLSVLLIINAINGHIALNVLYFHGAEHKVVQSLLPSALLAGLLLFPLTFEFGIFGTISTVLLSNFLVLIIQLHFASRIMLNLSCTLVERLAVPTVITLGLGFSYLLFARTGISFAELNVNMVFANILLILCGAAMFWGATHFKQRLAR